MKKLLKLLCLGICLCSFAACSSSKKDLSETYNFESITTDEFIEILKNNNLPVDNVITYDEKTDPNNLLGKPNEYIAKANFADTRLHQYSVDDPEGGTIEIFTNHKDAQARYDYIDLVAHSGPLSSYMYIYDNVVIRLSKSLSIDEAKEYEDIFIQIKENKIQKADTK